MWSPNELLKIEKQRDILSYITLQFFHFKKVPLEHCPLGLRLFFWWNGGRMSFWLSWRKVRGEFPGWCAGDAGMVPLSARETAKGEE